MITYREKILKCVTDNQALKVIELAIRVMCRINPVKFNKKEYETEIDKLVEEGEIVEVCYVLPTIDKLKSLYFPKGTKVGSQTEI